MFANSETPLSSILIKPYSKLLQSATSLLINKVTRDGLEFTQSANEELNKLIWELTDFFVQGLKKRIAENNEWDDNDTLPFLIFFIIRNNVIKYYHDRYIKELGYENLEIFCENIPNALSREADIFAYVYYYIYETNIDFPIARIYHNICSDIKNTLESQKQKKLENELFGTGTKSDYVV